MKISTLQKCKYYLHSTMYLLKLRLLKQDSLKGINLHSTMYLLKHYVAESVKQVYLFTFHHVSIKTHIIIILELP